MSFMGKSKKSDPRERILEVANRLFYADGVRVTGTEKIMSKARMPSYSHTTTSRGGRKDKRGAGGKQEAIGFEPTTS